MLQLLLIASEYENLILYLEIQQYWPERKGWGVTFASEVEYCDNARHKHKAEQASEHADEEGEEVGVEEVAADHHQLLLGKTWLLFPVFFIQSQVMLLTGPFVKE